MTDRVLDLGDVSVVALVVVLTLLTCVVALIAVRSIGMLRRIAEPLPDGAIGGRTPRVSVIVPLIGAIADAEPCVRSLVAQSYPDLDVAVVTLAEPPQWLTAMAGDSDRLRVVAAGAPPAEWTDEAWARERGAEQATGEWLLFTTPNTTAQPTMVTAALAFSRKHRLDALTLFGRPIAKGFWERVINPVVYQLLSLANPVPQINNPTLAGVALVLAEFLLIRRQVYRDSGGYRAVATRSSPHRVLARLIKTSGYRLWIGDGSAFFQTRRYRTFQHARDGWTATLRVIADQGPGVAWAAVALVAVFDVLPFVLFVGGLIGSLFETRSAIWTTVALIGLVQVAFVVGARRKIDTLCGTPFWYAALHPVGGILLASFLVSSMQSPRPDGTMQPLSHQL